MTKNILMLQCVDGLVHYAAQMYVRTTACEITGKAKSGGSLTYVQKYSPSELSYNPRAMRVTCPGCIVAADDLPDCLMLRPDSHEELSEMIRRLTGQALL